MLLQKWDNIQALTPMPQPVQHEGKSIGFLLVYDDLKALRRDYKNAKYLKLESVKP